MVTCAGCNTEAPPGSRWCPICHSNLLKPTIGRLASPGRRLGAYVMDLVIPLAALFVMFGFLGAGVRAGSVTSQDAGPLGCLVIGAFVIGYLVWALLLYTRGQSPGKRVLGMTVVKENGEPARFWTMLFRETIGKFLSGIVFGLGYLWILFDKDRQAWHDKLASTFVVQGAVLSATVAAASSSEGSSQPPVGAAAASVARSAKPLLAGLGALILLAIVVAWITSHRHRRAAESGSSTAAQTSQQASGDTRSEQPAKHPARKRVRPQVASGEEVLTTIGDYELPYQEIGISVSPDGRRAAYLARQGEKEFIVVGDKKDPEFARVNFRVPPILWSPDGEHIAYSASDGKENFVVLDGRRGTGYRCDPQIAFDASGEVAFSSCDQKGPFAVVGGNRTDLSLGGGALVVSPNGRSFAFDGSRTENDSYVVLNGRVGPDFIVVHSLTFSPDSESFCYAALDDHGYCGSGRQGAWHVVREGMKDPCFSLIGDLTFTSAGELAYLASQGNDQFLVVGSRRLPLEHRFTIPNELEPRLVVSGDGSTATYVGIDQQTKQRFAVSLNLQGNRKSVKGPNVDRIDGPLFVNEGGKSAGYTAVKKAVGLGNAQQIAMVGSQTSPPSNRVWSLGFAENDHFVYAALDGNRVIRRELATN